MIFQITDAKNTREDQVEINTLEELLDFIADCGHDVIVYRSEPKILIYNDYVE